MAHPDQKVAAADEQSWLSFLRQLPVLLLVALILAFLLRTFVVQVFYIPSASMVPTLQEQDRMVVEKVTFLFREPQRGEIIVFKGGADEGTGRGGLLGIVTGVGRFVGVVPADAQDFVKRVIGLPGDTILIENGEVLVNGTAIDEPYVVNEDLGSYGPYEVPSDSLFLMGDNRPGSSDSRGSMGYVPLDHVVGRPVLTIWPPDHMGRLQQ